MKNALTIDVEDYYHVAAFASVIKPADWEGFESRVAQNTNRLLDILDEYGKSATFFVLGWVAERHPNLVTSIYERGHEVASHGYSHKLIYTQTPEQFREETRRTKNMLEDITGEAVIGYRAASYSITLESLWALDILIEEGFKYDSSIFPIQHDRYGIPGHKRFFHILKGNRCGSIAEFPPSTVGVAGFTIPVAGGGYLRLFPYMLTNKAIEHLNKHEKQPAIVYLHPWEIDTDQPRIKASMFSRFRHYNNLDKMEYRLRGLLENFIFVPMRELYLAQIAYTQRGQLSVHDGH